MTRRGWAWAIIHGNIYVEKKQSKTKCILVPFIFMTVEWRPL